MKKALLIITIFFAFILDINAKDNFEIIYLHFKKEICNKNNNYDVSTQIDSLQNTLKIKITPSVTWNESTFQRLSTQAIQNTGSDASVQNLKRIYSISVHSISDVTALIHTLEQSNLFEKVYLDNNIVTPPWDYPPTTPSYKNIQGYLRADSGVNIHYAWSKGIFGQNIKVIDIEYGLNQSHEKLVDQPISILNNLTPYYYSDGVFDHGTAVFSIVCGDKLDYGMSGMMYEIDTMLLSPEYTVEYGYNRTDAIKRAIEYANPGDFIIYEMQRGVESSTDYGPADLTPVIWDMTKAAVDAGIIIVAAAGNGGVNLDNDPRLAEYRNRGDNGSIIVGAGTPDTKRDRLNFSTYGSRVNVQGWGYNVIAAGYGTYASIGGDTNQNYVLFSGTSSASPVVASCAIAIQSYYHSLTDSFLNCREIREILINTGKPQGNNIYGHIGPLPNVKVAFDYIDKTVNPTIEENDITIYPNPSKSNIIINNSVLATAKNFFIFDVNGRIVITDNTPSNPINVNMLQPGHYFIVIVGHDKSITKYRFVKL